MTRRTDRLWLVAAALVVAAGGALRVAGAMGELWFDEIWSLFLVDQRASTPFHVFWSVQHDNVHGLYGLYAALLPTHPSPLLYRLPAVIFGTGTIIVAGMIGWRDGKAQAIIAMVLVAFSYPLVHYGSEARGYAPMIFFVLVAFLLIEGDLKSGDPRRAIWAAFACGAAVLSHLSAVFAVVALVLWAALFRFSETRSVWVSARLTLEQLLPTFIAVTLVISLWVAAFAVNGYEFGALGSATGFADRFVDGVGDMVKLMFGASYVSPATALTAATAIALALIVWQFAISDPRAAFNTLMLFGVIGGLFCAGLPGPAFGRYYLFALVFLIPLAAQGLAKLLAMGGARRIAAALLLSLFLAGNGWANGNFLNYGRGSAESILSAIGRDRTGEIVEVAVDHKFRFNMLFAYHAARMNLGFDMRMVPFEKTGDRPPNWLVLHDVPYSSAPLPPPRIPVARGTYELEAINPQWGFSGFTLYLYRLANGGGRRALLNEPSRGRSAGRASQLRPVDP